MHFLFSQLDDTRRLADTEQRDKATLIGKFRALEADLERLKDKIDSEAAARGDLQKAAARASAEAQLWKSKFGTEAVARIDDLEVNL